MSQVLLCIAALGLCMHVPNWTAWLHIMQSFAQIFLHNCSAHHLLMQITRLHSSIGQNGRPSSLSLLDGGQVGCASSQVWCIALLWHNLRTFCTELSVIRNSAGNFPPMLLLCCTQPPPPATASWPGAAYTRSPGQHQWCGCATAVGGFCSSP